MIVLFFLIECSFTILLIFQVLYLHLQMNTTINIYFFLNLIMCDAFDINLVQMNRNVTKRGVVNKQHYICKMICSIELFLLFSIFSKY